MKTMVQEAIGVDSQINIWKNSTASWICQDNVGDMTNLYLHFSRQFDLAEPEPLKLFISAVSQYYVTINGAYIGRGPAVAHQGYYYYHEYDIPAQLVHSGCNHICVHLFHDGETTETLPKWRFGKPGLLVHLAGDGWNLGSDSAWRVRHSPDRPPIAGLICKWIGYKEIYHGESYDNWEEPGYDYSKWNYAVEVAPPISEDFVSNLVPLDVLELRERCVIPERIVELSPNLGYISKINNSFGDLLRTEKGIGLRVSPGEPMSAPSVTFDFGKILVGFPEVALSGGPCTFEVWYGETLDLYRLDAVHLPPNGTWNAFQRRAFRFLKLKFIALGGEVSISHVGQNAAEYPFNDTGCLVTSDEQINKIMDVSLDTLRANTSYHYEDCPIREQALWVLDMRIMAMVNAYLCGNHELTAKCIRQSFAIQRDDGAVPATGPRVNQFYHHDFMLHLVACLWEHYQHTGDCKIVCELYPKLLKLYEFTTTWVGEDGLVDTDLDSIAPDVSVFMDWNDKIAKSGKTTYLNSLYILYLEHMAGLAQVFGKDPDAQAYLRKADIIRVGVRQLLYSQEKKAFCDAWRAGQLIPVFSQQSNLAAILAGIPTEEQTGHIINMVLNDKTCIQPGSASTYWVVFMALAKVGKLENIESLVRQYWGAMLDRGATTWWEVFNPSLPSWTYPHVFLGHCPMPERDWIPVSCCHAWSSVPGYAIPQYLLGIDLSQVYKGKIVLHQGIGLSYERVTYKLPMNGELLHLEFSQKNGKTDIKVVEKPSKLEVIIEPGSTSK